MKYFAVERSCVVYLQTSHSVQVLWWEWGGFNRVRHFAAHQGVRARSQPTSPPHQHLSFLSTHSLSRFR